MEPIENDESQSEEPQVAADSPDLTVPQDVENDPVVPDSPDGEGSSDPVDTDDVLGGDQTDPPVPEGPSDDDLAVQSTSEAFGADGGDDYLEYMGGFDFNPAEELDPNVDILPITHKNTIREAPTLEPAEPTALADMTAALEDAPERVHEANHLGYTPNEHFKRRYVR